VPEVPPSLPWRGSSPPDPDPDPDGDRARRRRGTGRSRIFDLASGDPTFARLGRRRTRRQLVVAHVLLTIYLIASLVLFAAGPRFIAAAVFGPRLGPALAAGFAVVLVVAWFAVTGMVNFATQGIAELPGEALDEVQATLRRDVEAASYRVVIRVMAIVAFLAASALGGLAGRARRLDADPGPLIDLSLTGRSLLLGGVLLLSASLALLPRWRLAWQLPDVED
jgi:uncharacterized membrane protein (DUF485 family)